jgi:hypothetical protein
MSIVRKAIIISQSQINIENGVVAPYLNSVCEYGLVFRARCTTLCDKVCQ